jgi:hypothetical protein
MVGIQEHTAGFSVIAADHDAAHAWAAGEFTSLIGPNLADRAPSRYRPCTGLNT